MFFNQYIISFIISYIFLLKTLDIVCKNVYYKIYRKDSIFLFYTYILSYIKGDGNMTIKISDLMLPKDKLEKEYQVVQVTQWRKDGEKLGWNYECILPKLRFEKIKVKVSSELPVISQEELAEEGLAVVTFDNLEVRPWGRVNGSFVNYGLAASATKATLISKKA